MPKMKKECKEGVILTYDTTKMGQEDVVQNIFNDLKGVSDLFNKKK